MPIVITSNFPMDNTAQEDLQQWLERAPTFRGVVPQHVYDALPPNTTSWSALWSDWLAHQHSCISDPPRVFTEAQLLTFAAEVDIWAEGHLPDSIQHYESDAMARIWGGRFSLVLSFAATTALHPSGGNASEAILSLIMPALKGILYLYSRCGLDELADEARHGVQFVTAITQGITQLFVQLHLLLQLLEHGAELSTHESRPRASHLQVAKAYETVAHLHMEWSTLFANHIAGLPRLPPTRIGLASLSDCSRRRVERQCDRMEEEHSDMEAARAEHERSRIVIKTKILSTELALWMARAKLGEDIQAGPVGQYGQSSSRSVQRRRVDARGNRLPSTPHRYPFSATFPPPPQLLADWGQHLEEALIDLLHSATLCMKMRNLESLTAHIEEEDWFGPAETTRYQPWDPVQLHGIRPLKPKGEVDPLCDVADHLDLDADEDVEQGGIGRLVRAGSLERFLTDARRPGGQEEVEQSAGEGDAMMDTAMPIAYIDVQGDRATTGVGDEARAVRQEMDDRQQQKGQDQVPEHAMGAEIGMRYQTEQSESGRDGNDGEDDSEGTDGESDATEEDQIQGGRPNAAGNNEHDELSDYDSDEEAARRVRPPVHHPDIDEDERDQILYSDEEAESEGGGEEQRASAGREDDGRHEHDEILYSDEDELESDHDAEEEERQSKGGASDAEGLDDDADDNSDNEYIVWADDYADGIFMDDNDADDEDDEGEEEEDDIAAEYDERQDQLEVDGCNDYHEYDEDHDYEYYNDPDYDEMNEDEPFVTDHSCSLCNAELNLSHPCPLREIIAIHAQYVKYRLEYWDSMPDTDEQGQMKKSQGHAVRGSGGKVGEAWDAFGAELSSELSESDLRAYGLPKADYEAWQDKKERRKSLQPGKRLRTLDSDSDGV